jgi:predicted kinase
MIKMKDSFKQFINSKIKDGFLLISCGLPGTGKSWATEEAQRIKGGKLIKSDVVRREVLKGQDVFSAEVAGDPVKRAFVYDEMFRQADTALNTEKNVILDATFVAQSLRQRAAHLAAKHRVACIILETQCPEDICLLRILARDKATSISNAVTEEAYRANRKAFESVDPDNLKKLYPTLEIIHLVVDTSGSTPDEWHVTGLVKL